jgi:hypothetical protein
MLTDTPPRKANRAGFLESDRIKTLDLPQNAALTEIAQGLESAMQTERIPDVRKACAEFLAPPLRFVQPILECEIIRGYSRPSES